MAPYVTRREALGGAAAALLLASCGGGDPPPATGPRAGSGVALLGSLLALQHATIAAYGACEEVLRGNALTLARAIREQEAAIASDLGTIMAGAGTKPPRGRSDEEYRRTFPRLESADDALHFADDLEQRQVRAYLAALSDFPSEGNRDTAAGIAARNGAHL